MNILAVTPYARPEGGGLERYAETILRGLVARGHVVRHLCMTREPSLQPSTSVRPRHAAKPGTLDAHAAAAAPSGHDSNYRLTRIPCRFRLGNAPLEPRFVDTLDRAITTDRPDVVVAHTPVPGAAEMAWRAARRHHVPFVVTFHAGRLRAAAPWLRPAARFHERFLQRPMVREATARIAVGAYVRDTSLGGPGPNTHVVPPGVDHARFRPGHARPGDHLLFVGRLSGSYRWKGLSTLIRAMGRLRDAVPEAHLRVVGDGPLRPEYERLAGSVGARVTFVGRAEEDELVREYQSCRALVLPSLTDAEAFGMVMAEANACGRPVVGSAVGGIPDFVRPGDNGWLADPGDPGSLAASLQQVYADPGSADRMGARGRARVVAEHDWERLAERTERVLLEAVGSSPARRDEAPVLVSPA